MDVDEEERHHDDVLLLFGAEGELLRTQKHLEDVDGRSHPSCMVGVGQPIGHLQLVTESNQILSMDK